MPNTIEYAAQFQRELDKAAVEQATSGWMELNDSLVKYDGGAEVKIPMLDMDGLGDYDRDEGFVDGSVNLKWQTKEMTMDRGRKFTIDENDTSETAFVLTASTIMGEFQREKVVPEIDAYRYSSIGTGAIEEEKVTYGYTPDESTILKALYHDLTLVQDEVGDNTPLVITMNTLVAGILDMNDKLSRTLSVTEFKQGDLTMKVNSLNGQHPIIRVGSGRMKTEYIFRDGKSSGQQAGGFVASGDAMTINWIICPKNAPIAVSRTDKVRIFDPETYQKSRSWAMDYRKYHDLWVPKKAWKSMRVNVQEDAV